ncbi:MAG: hypothetical protein COT55_01015, partial [Candidatus Diapherotrites archaeon CG09_land_8_20_14_0_10_32_12]
NLNSKIDAITDYWQFNAISYLEGNSNEPINTLDFVLMKDIDFEKKVCGFESYYSINGSFFEEGINELNILCEGIELEYFKEAYLKKEDTTIMVFANEVPFDDYSNFFENMPYECEIQISNFKKEFEIGIPFYNISN